MKNELNRTVDILQTLTTKVVDINKKASTLLTNQQFNVLNTKIDELSGLLGNNSQNELTGVPTIDTINQLYSFDVVSMSDNLAEYFTGTYVKVATDTFELTTSDGMCYLTTQNLYDNGKYWVFYNQQFTTDPYWAVKVDNPFTVSDWEGNTIVFGNFVYTNN